MLVGVLQIQLEVLDFKTCMEKDGPRVMKHLATYPC